MPNLNLQLNESIILQKDAVRHGNEMVELYLTNLNIIYVLKGVFGNVKKIQKLPLNQIKVVNGRVQAFLGNESKNGWLQLQLYFINGVEIFGFPNKERREISTWINNISQILTGEASQDATVKNIMAIPGTEYIAETMKDTIGVFKDKFGINNKGNQKLENVTVKCIGCMAPLSGKKGQTVRCKYCDTDNTL